MIINRVVIKNFKSLKNIDITLSNLTLITGVNSTGKSSFIQFLLLLKQNQEKLKTITNNKMLKKSILASERSTTDTNQALLKSLDKSMNLSFILNGEYIELGDEKDILYQDAYDENISIKLFVEKLNYLVSFSSQDLKINIDAPLPLEVLVNIFNDDFQYIMTDRISPSITYPLSELHIKQNLIGLRGEYAAHYLAKNRHQLLNIEKLKHPKSITNQLLENTSLWLSEISNDIEISAKIYTELQQANLTYKYTYGENTTNEYSPLNVGFGITYVLPIIVAILKAKPNDLLIIENPESHLHPAGQSKIAELCAIASSCGVQIIVETHSDHFLNGLRVSTKKEIIKPEQSQIYYFSKEKDSLETKVSKLTIDTEGNINENWPKGFFDEYRNQLDELLW